MTPVAILRRAALLPALVSGALLVGHAIAAPEASDASPTATTTGLKPRGQFHLADGVFKSDAQPQATDTISADDDVDANSISKNDYSLAGSIGSRSGLVLERGTASWYGKVFHGRKTSSGDRFDMYALTAAHPSLPIPSYIRVTNLSNGRSVVVRVNDRGPFHPGRIVDLSYAAADRLGYADKGQANVEIALVLPEEVSVVRPARPVPPLRRAHAPQRVTVAAAQPAPAPAAASASEAELHTAATNSPTVAAQSSAQIAPPLAAVRPADTRTGEVFLQLGVFGTAAAANYFKTFVESELRWLKESVSVLASGGKYRLRVGPFPSSPEARSIAERIADTLKLKASVVPR